MFSHILVTCVGNICRSPMAEALLRHHCTSHISHHLEIRSAGIHALIGHPADPLAEQLMTECGLDISQHRGQKLSPQLVQWADIILVMEQEHKRYIESRNPTARGKVFRLLEDEKRDIPDPYQQDKDAFSKALTLIQKGVEEWVIKLS
ncbi:MAG: low molecular weight phosphotyrosine protein phosphatase [Sedimenticola sp.]|nr:low molecular weight phosphotyrosine protein phosphatase [Sedimenticola sp.]